VNQTLRRVFVMLCAGVGVWILVFWLYEPRDPTVSYGGAPFHGGGNSLAQLDTIAGAPEGVAEGGAEGAAEGFDDVSLDATVDVAPRSVPSPTFVPRVVAPEFWEYTVQRGDSTWETVAEKTLGDRKLASAVLRANPLVSPDKLIPGRTRLKIPRDPKNIQGKVVHEAVTPVASGSATATPASTGGSAPTATTAPAPAARTHTVVKGETLSAIAQAELGSATRWREIYEVNKGVIPDPDRLKLGTVLRIPGEKPKP